MNNSCFFGGTTLGANLHKVKHKNNYNKQKINCNYNFQQLWLHCNSNLVVVIINCNSGLEKENVPNKKILTKHVNNNV